MQTPIVQENKFNSFNAAPVAKLIENQAVGFAEVD